MYSRRGNIEALIWIVIVAQIDKVSAISEKLKWPLSSVYPYAEVKNGDSGGTSGTGSDVTTCPHHPNLDYPSILFHGTSDSYIDLPATSGFNMPKFSFSMFIDAQAPFTGVILHYKNTASGGNMAEVMLWMNGSHVIVDAVDKANTQYQSLVVTNLFDTGDSTFVPFSFGYYDDGRALVTTDGANLLDITISPWSRTFGFPCDLRVGGAIPSSYFVNDGHFKGRVTCLNVYEDLFQDFDFSTALSQCPLDKWDEEPDAMTSLGTAECTGSGDDNLYVISAVGSAPLTSLPILDSMPTSNKLRCAKRCAEYGSICQSFSVEMDTQHCRLFDSVISSAQHHMIPNSKYYTKPQGNCVTC